MPVYVDKSVNVEVEVSDDEIIAAAKRDPRMASEIVKTIASIVSTEPADVESAICSVMLSLGATRTMIDSQGTVWRCRAWFGSRFVEGRHRRRVSAAVLCLANAVAL